MRNVHIHPDKILEELMTFGQKLGRGIETLKQIGEVPSGVSPKELVYEEDKLKLYHYKHPEGAPEPRAPILIIYALVNRPYMVDLQEHRSTVRGLLNAGLDVYLIDWGYPDRADRFINLDDYVNGYINHCVDVVRKRSGADAINILGICQGGVLSLSYVALHPEKVKNLVTMVTPVDFHVPEFIFGNLLRHVDVNLMIDTTGNVPGELLNAMFLSLKPFRLTGQKYIDMVDLLDDPKQMDTFMRMEKWIFDSPNLAGEAFRQFAIELVQQNKLVKGGFTINGRAVRLKNVTMPVLNIYAMNDDIVPPSASKPLKNLVGTRDYTEIAFPGGHIGIYTGGKSKDVPPAIGQWVTARI